MNTSIAALADLVSGGGVVVLTGAGISTESGIPDYRGPSGVARRHTPMTYQVFTGDAAARRRYWARSHVGWRTIARAAPNAGHRAVARLQEYGLVAGIVTQNVDGLHQAGGAHDVNELHGNLDRVVCLDCRSTTSREVLDGRLWAANPDLHARALAVNPDGDVELADEIVNRFRMVDCAGCGGTLKPDVVFFGETVPRERVLAAFDCVDAARALLVLGSSLAVHSGRRFVTHAARRGIPVAIVNQGPTRSDDRAHVRVDAPLGTVLPALAAACANRDGARAVPGPHRVAQLGG
ncbi:NAD-dependent protein deacetylase [Luedemannella helvata]|uniref:NAD-dependent protein deacetylase n=1 Tax=Luedemannella helvata TaxID=349315 RepID=A0ABN2KTR7_9ACTN